MRGRRSLAWSGLLIAAAMMTSIALAQDADEYPSWFGPESRAEFGRMRDNLGDLNWARGLLVFARVYGPASIEGAVAEVIAPSPDTEAAFGSFPPIARHIIRSHAVGMVGRPGLNAQERAFWEALLESGEGSPSGRSYGEPHVRTFDGLHYTFQAAGEFVALRSLDGDLEVQARLEPRAERVSVNSAVAARVSAERVGLYVEQDPPLRVDGEPVPAEVRTIYLPSGGLVIQDAPRFYVVWPDLTTLSVRIWRGSHLEYWVRLPDPRKGRVEGLLGNWNGRRDDDLQVPGGGHLDTEGIRTGYHVAELHDAFDDGWRVGSGNSLFDYLPGESAESFAIDDFPRQPVALDTLGSDLVADAKTSCEERGVSEPYLATCIYDVAVTGEVVFADAAAQVVEDGARERESSIDTGVERAGKLLHLIALPNSEGCAAACVEDPGCVAWSHVQTSPRSPRGACSLMHSARPPTERSNVISGVIVGKTLSDCQEYAHVAVLQNAHNVAAGCGLAGEEWHDDPDRHAAWCQSNETNPRHLRQLAQLASERHRALRKCSAN